MYQHNSEFDNVHLRAWVCHIFSRKILRWVHRLIVPYSWKTLMGIMDMMWAMAPSMVSLACCNEKKQWLESMVSHWQHQEPLPRIHWFHLDPLSKATNKYSDSRIQDLIQSCLWLYSTGLMYKAQNEKGDVVDWKTYAEPFHWLSWTGLIILVLLSLMTFALTVWINPQKQCPNNSSILTGFQVFLRQGAPEEPSTNSSRLGFLVILITGTLTWCSYSATLTSYLATKNDKIPFTSLEEMLYQTDYKLVTTDGSSYLAFLKVSYALL